MKEARDDGPLDSPEPPTKRMKRRSISWGDEVLQSSCNNSSNNCSDVNYPDDSYYYENPEDIWYTRDDYQQFHLDRYRTVECLRASGGNEAVLNPEFYCCRGLEPFMTPEDVSELHSSRRIYKSTIMLEQARQNLLAIKDPERYRVMVAPQSEFALRRAQQLAYMDQSEIYCSSYSFPIKRASPTLGQMPLMPITQSEPIRTMQEQNARRLMNLYAPKSTSTTTGGGGEGEGKDSATTATTVSRPTFRFNIRRDSLMLASLHKHHHHHNYDASSTSTSTPTGADATTTRMSMMRMPHSTRF
eukprot:scaffold22602_cov154-Cylindrotheca_fusiformis.AAC.6